MKNIVAIAARELLAIFTSAIAWVFLTSFLLFNGLFFCALITLASQPGQGASVTEALSSFLGGNLFYWLFILAMIPLITMRLIAEEKRTGTIETLLTAPVSDHELVLGKFAAALVFYAALWLPSILYVGIMSAYGTVDWGPIASAYLSILLTGAALLGLGLFTSSMTHNQIVAAFLCFVLLLFVFSLGAILEAVFPGSGAEQSVFRYINIWTHAEDFGKGIVDTRPLIYNLSLMLAGIFGAAAVLGWRHRNAANRLSRYVLNLAVLVVAVLALIVMANYFSARHYRRFDWTVDRYFSLSAQTEAVVKGLTRPVSVTVFLDQQKNRLYPEVRELLERYAALSPQLTVEYVDARDPVRAQQLAQKYQVSSYGVVIFACGDKTKYVGESDLADLDYSGMGMGQGADVTNFRGEEKITSAIVEVTLTDRPLLCFVTGHGEPELTQLRGLLTQENFAVEDLNLLAAGRVPDSCAAVVVVAPRHPLAAAELDAIRAYLDRGGHALLALDPVLQQGNTVASSGLEALVARYGITVNNDIVIEDDPEFRVAQLGAGAFWVTQYGDHAIGRPLNGLPTIFLYARSLAAAETLPAGVTVSTLAQSSYTSWGERDFAAMEQGAKKDATDIAGPCPLALVAANDSTNLRLVVFGDGDFVASEQIQGAGNPLLVRNCINFLAERTGLLGIPPRNPKSVNLTLSEAQRDNFFWVTVVLIPLATLVGGIYLWLRRRF
ncbi:MAG TPA: Gldg family protein [bacterium]|nr:Gldg family protein [bacterium]